jgi:hypothetical protein
VKLDLYEVNTHTFSTSPRAYICLAVRLDVQIGSISYGSDGWLATPSALDVMVVRDKRVGRIDAGSKIRNSLKSAKTYMHCDVKLKDTKTRSKKVATMLSTRSPPSLHISQRCKWIRRHRHGRIATPTSALPTCFPDYSAMYRLECFCPFLQGGVTPLLKVLSGSPWSERCREKIYRYAYFRSSSSLIPTWSIRPSTLPSKISPIRRSSTS